MWREITFVALTATTLGCSVAQPVITDIQTDMVKVTVEIGMFDTFPDEKDILAEAQRGCEQYGRRASKVSSKMSVLDDSIEMIHLFTCL